MYRQEERMEWKTKEELLQHARILEGHSVKEAIQINQESSLVSVSRSASPLYKGKGGFGDYLEENYFGKKNDTESRPDFDELGIELKSVPLKINNDGSIRVKERIVLNKFRFYDIVNETFETSHFLKKDAILLLIFYFHNNQLAMEDKKINLVDLWEVLNHDANQIRADWEYIVNKIKEGKAHELSEGDTLYLGACTKGATAQKSMQAQPFSTIMAPGRALCFKVSYANMIYKVLLQNKSKRKELIFNSIYNGQAQWMPLEERVHQLVDKYTGMSGEEISNSFHKSFSLRNKSRYANIARYMLGFSTKEKQYYEFEAANIQVKSVRIEANDSVKEAMSFKNIPYVDIVSQEWEDSDFYNELTSKFIFMFFKKCNNAEDYCFDGFSLWNMPVLDLEKAHEVWEKAKQMVKEGKYNEMPCIKQTSVAHVRPKAKDSSDLMPTPQGGFEKKKCFWLNKSYIKEKIVKRHLLEKVKCSVKDK